MKERKMVINKTQKKVIAIAIPVIVVLVGFSVIGSRNSPDLVVPYLTKHGVEWSLVVLLIGAFEFFWWKDREKKSK